MKASEMPILFGLTIVLLTIGTAISDVCKKFTIQEIPIQITEPTIMILGSWHLFG